MSFELVNMPRQKKLFGISAYSYKAKRESTRAKHPDAPAPITAAHAHAVSDEHESAPHAPPAATDAASDAPSVLSVPLTPSHPFTPTL